jgi:hypothetical protein
MRYVYINEQPIVIYPEYNALFLLHSFLRMTIILNVCKDKRKESPEITLQISNEMTSDLYNSYRAVAFSTKKP